MSCPHCRNGSTINRMQGGNFGNGEIDGVQAKRCASHSPAATVAQPRVGPVVVR